MIQNIHEPNLNNTYSHKSYVAPIFVRFVDNYILNSAPRKYMNYKSEKFQGYPRVMFL